LVRTTPPMSKKIADMAGIRDLQKEIAGDRSRGSDDGEPPTLKAPS
jgi:hypothetical protein